MEQLVSSMGVEDLQKGKEMLSMVQMSGGKKRILNKIDYKSFNSIQNLDDKEREDKYEIVVDWKNLAETKFAISGSRSCSRGLVRLLVGIRTL